jgi:uncharacterized membrane protein YdfJ with MMPL/SSD domain
VHGRLALGIVRRPGRALAVNLALLGLAAALAIGAADRVAVAGGLGSYTRSDPSLLVVALEARPAFSAAVSREALVVIRSRLDADPRVADVERARVEPRSRVSVLEVRLDDMSASDRQRAAEEIADGIDPGPLELAVGGEAMVQAAARDRLEDELWRVLLLGAPLVIVALLIAFGPRHAVAPVIAGATGVLGAFAGLRLLAEFVDLGAAGLGTSLAVGLAVGAEGCAALRRRFLGDAAGPPAARVRAAMQETSPRVAVAAAGAALASLAVIAIALPAARSSALGGALAALLAGASALVAMPSVLALSPAPAERGARAAGRFRRLREAVASRPWLGWLPALLVVGALGVAASQAFDPEVRTVLADDIPASSDAARAASLVSEASPADVESRLIGAPGGAGPPAGEEIRDGLPPIAVLVTVFGLAAAYAATRSRRDAFARGIATALPALAVCGVLAAAGSGDLPLEIDLGRLSSPQPSALLMALAGVAAVSTARAALGDARAALIGTVVASAALAALAASDLDGVAQAGVAVAAGLVLDLALIRAVLVPALDHALPRGAPRVPVPRLPARLRR